MEAFTYHGRNNVTHLVQLFETSWNDCCKSRSKKKSAFPSATISRQSGIIAVDEMEVNLLCSAMGRLFL